MTALLIVLAASGWTAAVWLLATRRAASRQPAPSAWGRHSHRGKLGHALCNGSTEVIDQAAVDERNATRLYGNKPSIESMDECKACAKKAAKLATTST